MVQEAVPFLLQPKLKAGFWLDGDVASASFTLATFPFVAHTLTFHWAVWPRAILASSLCRRTHSCSGGVVASVRVKLTSVAVTGALSSVWVTNALVLAEGLALPDDVALLDVSPLISGLSRPVCSAEPDAPDADGESVPELDGSVPESDVLGDAEDEEEVGVGVRVVKVGVGVAVVPGGVVLGAVVVGELDGLDGLVVAVGCTFSQVCLVVPLTADVCACSVRACTA